MNDKEKCCARRKTSIGGQAFSSAKINKIFIPSTVTEVNGSTKTLMFGAWAETQTVYFAMTQDAAIGVMNASLTYSTNKATMIYEYVYNPEVDGVPGESAQ